MSEETAIITVEAPRGNAVARLTPEEEQGLQKDQPLYISFYNMSGTLPEPDDFELAGEWPDEIRRQMGLKPRGERQKLITTIAGHADLINSRLGGGQLRQSHIGPGIMQVDCKMERLGWITHFLISDKDGNKLAAGEFEQYTPTQTGNGFMFGIRLNPQRASINARPEQKKIT
jgi:hypothetical protein